MSDLDLVEEKTFRIHKDSFDESVAIELGQRFKGRFEVEFPSPVNGYHYSITPKGYVGQLKLGDTCTVRIQPKIAITSVFRLLDYAYGLKSLWLANQSFEDVGAIQDTFESLASLLARGVLDRNKRGLFAAYVKGEDWQRTPRGRIRLLETAVSVIKGSTKVLAAFEEHTVDIEDNRILAWTLFLLSKSQIEQVEVRRNVLTAYRALSQAVTVTPCSSALCINRAYHRLNHDYELLHGLCRLFLEHVGPSMSLGPHTLFPFLIYMPGLYELFVAEWLTRHIPDRFKVEKQYSNSLDAQGEFKYRIDLVLHDDKTGEILAVLDTKYVTASSTKQIAQVTAYALAVGAHNAFVVFPSAESRTFNISVSSNVRVRSIVFDLNSDIEQSGEAFMAELLSYLPES